MIESARQSFAVGDRQIELELVSATARRIGPGRIRHLRTAATKVEPAFPFGLDARGAVEKPRKLGERDRLPVVEFAGRMTFMQQLCDRRNDFRRRCRKLAQVDFLSGPAGPHRGWRRYDAGVWIKSAQRVGLPAFRAVGVEQKIVK